MLRKSPGFTAIALITLAVAIGANTIVFSISDVLLFLQPKGIRNREQLAYCAFQDARYSWFLYSEYLAVRDSGLAFCDVYGCNRSLSDDPGSRGDGTGMYGQATFRPTTSPFWESFRSADAAFCLRKNGRTVLLLWS